MPQRTKKDHKHGHNTGSRWHNFHFSGKLISCSVIFGFLLILVGGILLAIGMDRDEESKSGDYGDLQKKPPLVFVGPVIMGIGGFTVIVGVIMCLVETKVFRRRGGDANPLINSEEGEGSSRRHSEAINGESGAATIPPTSKHYRKHRHGNRSPKKTRNGNRSHSSKETSPSSSHSSEPIGISGKSPRSYLVASDTFVTPPGSITQEDLQMQGKRDAVNQTSASLLKSFNSSGTYSTEFQTPSASFIDSASFPSIQNSPEMPTSKPLLNVPGNLNLKPVENARHAFLTPQSSNADILEPATKSIIKPNEENSPVVNRHAFLTPKNSADLLEESPPSEQGIVNSSNHLPGAFLGKKTPEKVTTVSVVADIHEPSKQDDSDMNNGSDKSSTSHSLAQEEVEHSDIKVDVLIEAIDDEVKGNILSNASNAAGEETQKTSENNDSNQSAVVEHAQSMAGNSGDTYINEENELKHRADSTNEENLELTSGDNFHIDHSSNEDMDSQIEDHLDNQNDDHGD